MKQFHGYLFALLGALVVSGVVFAQDQQKVDPRFTPGNLLLIEQNLIAGLRDTDHPGLQESSGQLLLELQRSVPAFDYSDALFPLMTIVKDENEPSAARIYAALALHNLKSARGDYAIEMTAKMTDDTRVQKVCTDIEYASKP